MDYGQGGKNRSANLKKGFSHLTHEQLVENGRKGGKKAAANARRRKTIKEDLLAVLNEPAGKDGKTIQEYWVRALMKNLLRGDVRTSVFVRDTIGEMPREEERDFDTEAVKGLTIKFVDGSEKERENDEED